MIIVKTIKDLNSILYNLSLKPGKLALIPTMGNLHDGHLSLIKLAKLHSSKTITSIFINPLQFGKNEDFDKYPRTIVSDIDKLNDIKCDVLFIPDNKNEVFSNQNEINFIKSGYLGKELCGHIRPNHFDGVLTVVYRIFELINPNIAVFGAKDFQQQVLIQNMAKTYFPKLEFLIGPIIRSLNGLPLSSRNSYLSDEELGLASNLYKSLKESVKLYKNTKNIKNITETANNFLISKNLIPEYYELRDLFLNKINSENSLEKKIFLGSVKIGKTRIIDNLEF
jgi:pantoate--beta-alanine ligase